MKFNDLWDLFYGLEDAIENSSETTTVPEEIIKAKDLLKGGIEELASAMAGNVYKDKNYTGKDIVAIRQYLIDLIPTLTDRWTDFNESDIGMVYLEFLAGVTDMLNFYMDKQALETYITTAKQDKNIRNILRSMNYRIPLWGPARGRITLVFDEPLGFDAWMQVGHAQFSTLDGVIYQLKEDTPVAGYNQSKMIEVFQGEYKSLNVKSLELKANRRFYLDDKNVIDGTVEILQNDMPWEWCDDALLKYKGGKYFSLHKDSDARVYILFSPDWKEQLPVNDEELVVIKYSVTLGIEGEVAENAIVNVDRLMIAGMDYSDKVSILGHAATVGAWGEINPASLRAVAQDSMKLIDRYITVEDFATAVEQEPYVGQYVVADWKDYDLVQVPNLLKVWAVDRNGEPLSDVFRERLQEKLYAKGILDLIIETPDVNRIPYKISAMIRIKGKRDVRHAVQGQVIQYLNDLYGTENTKFGRRILMSKISSDIYSVSDLIEEVELSYPDADIIPSRIELPLLQGVFISIMNDNES